MPVRSLGREDPPKEEMATHSSILACGRPGQRSLAGGSPRGCKESDMSEHEHAHTSKFKCNYFVNYVLQQISKVKFIK